MALVTDRSELRRAEQGWPYVRLSSRVFRFDRSGRASLAAEIRYQWRGTQEDPPPDDRTLRSVVADLQRIAEEAELDDPAATAWLTERGIPTSAPAGQAADRGLSSLTALPGCPLPAGYQIPEPYTVAPDAVWLHTTHGGAERVAWAALTVLRVFIDPEGAQMSELSWLDRGRWRSHIVPRSVAKSGRQLVKQLGDLGLPATEADAKAAERWLAAVEVANQEVIPEVKIARHLGWQRDGAFVIADGHPYQLQGVDPQMTRPLEAHRQRGTLSGWQTAVKIAEKYPTVAVGVYAGLAAPLLQVLGVSSFTVNWGGRSTGGKTTAAQGGLSAWCDPDDAGAAVTSWATTATYYQARLGLAGNGIPILLDDTQTAKNPEFVSAALYQITQNQGKGRMGDWKTYRWRTIVLSTGERSALSFATHQGISARVLDLQGSPFGRSPDSGSDAQTFRQGLLDNYGHAGPAFIERLRAELDEHGTTRLEERHGELTELHRHGASDLARRRAPLVAVLRLAAELADAWSIVPFPPPPPEVWSSLFAANDPRDNRAEMALDVVREYVAVNADKLWTPHNDRAPASGWIGVDTKVGDDLAAVALVPEKLREALDRAGYELDAVRQGWLEMRALHMQESQRPQYLIKRSIDGRQTKCYVFTGAAMGHDNYADDGGNAE
ncbi:DUF927 domain-containing protein [Spirillospora sp. CA-142024]|uniref:DUF927 domain-containing protein n=1 Tax=Spirillospora sp. CA-142024 TaxID=3240036 RepID=UPI003D939E39